MKNGTENYSHPTWVVCMSHNRHGLLNLSILLIATDVNGKNVCDIYSLMADMSCVCVSLGILNIDRKANVFIVYLLLFDCIFPGSSNKQQPKKM